MEDKLAYKQIIRSSKMLVAKDNIEISTKRILPIKFDEE
jgi:hypothetical protein